MSNLLDQWQLSRLRASGGQRQTATLTGWGATDATLLRQQRGAEELTLSLAVETIIEAGPFSYGDMLELRTAAGALHWRGYVETTEPAAGGEEQRLVTRVVGPYQW